MRKAVQGGGVALSALALLVMTGLQAAAEPEELVETEALAAIEATMGELLDTAVPVADADTIVDTSDGITVELAADATEGVSLTTVDDVTLEIGLPFASEADTAAVIDGTVVFDNNNGSTTTPLVHEDGSLQILTTIADSNAPTEYVYEFPVDISLIPTEDGGVDLVDSNGWVVQHIAPPWAVDADGKGVPTTYEVRGATLIQLVAHDVGDAYPVVADPWFGPRYVLSSSQTNGLIALIGGGASVVTIAAALCNGTIAGAIPCTAGYGVIASIAAIGAAGLGYCNRSGKGIVIYGVWATNAYWCVAR